MNEEEKKEQEQAEDSPYTYDDRYYSGLIDE